MSAEKEYLNAIKEKYEQASGDLFLKNYSNDFRDKQLKNKAKGLKQKEIVDSLLRLVTDSIKEADGFLHVLVDDTIRVKKYCVEHEVELQQVIDCSMCKCMSCEHECKFNSCGNCSAFSKVTYCDKKECCMSKKEKSVLSLYNFDMGKDIMFNVLAIIESVKNDNTYILLENVDNEDDRQIFVVKETLEDTLYVPVDSEEELEYIVSIFMEN